MSEPPAFTIRDLTGAREMLVLEELQRAAWGYRDLQVHPSNIFRIHAHVGGVVAVAEDPDGHALGFVYGFPAYTGGEPWHHSHMLAVRPEARGLGVAEALKRHQRARALDQGLGRMTWTFDPLVARNARFNLGKLGARALTYHRDWYAEGDFPADRLMVHWDLTQQTLAHPPPAPEGERVLERQGELPGTPDVARTGPRLLAEVPMNVPDLSPAARLAWRLALRAVFEHYLPKGHAVTDLARQDDRAWYVLARVP